MPRRQTNVPRQWLITDERLGPDLLGIARSLPRGSGVLVRHHHLPRSDRDRLLRRLRAISVRRRLIVIDEASGEAARVHSAREIGRAQLSGVQILFLSPLFATRSHPSWKPLPRMRAAGLLRLAKVPVIALGGMDAGRFSRIAGLGFRGWAGIDAWSALRSLKSRGCAPKS